MILGVQEVMVGQYGPIFVWYKDHLGIVADVSSTCRAIGMDTKSQKYKLRQDDAFSEIESDSLLGLYLPEWEWWLSEIRLHQLHPDSQLALQYFRDYGRDAIEKAWTQDTFTMTINAEGREVTDEQIAVQEEAEIRDELRKLRESVGHLSETISSTLSDLSAAMGDLTQRVEVLEEKSKPSSNPYEGKTRYMLVGWEKFNGISIPTPDRQLFGQFARRVATQEGVQPHQTEYNYEGQIRKQHTWPRAIWDIAYNRYFGDQ